MPELRRDPLTGIWTIIATERAKRPQDFRRRPEPEDSAESCPFCPGAEHKTPEELDALRDAQGWQARVFTNKFPALAPPLSMEDGVAQSGAGGESVLFEGREARGYHEVLVTTPEHQVQPWELSAVQLDRVLELCQRRLRAIAETSSVAAVLALENVGAGAGASRRHPHMQLLGFSQVPDSLAIPIARAEQYARREGHNLWEHVVTETLRNGERLVAENEHFIAWAPYASAFPYELRLMPRDPHARFEQEQPERRALFASLYLETLQRLSTTLDGAPYNVVLHSAPKECGPEEFRWFLRILPRLSIQAGVEWGAQIFINPVEPEVAAKALREVVL